MLILNTLKAYSQVSYREPLKNYKIWFFLHQFETLLQVANFPKGIKQKFFAYEMRAIFGIKSHWRGLI